MYYKWTLQTEVDNLLIPLMSIFIQTLLNKSVLDYHPSLISAYRTFQLGNLAYFHFIFRENVILQLKIEEYQK